MKPCVQVTLLRFANLIAPVCLELMGRVFGDMQLPQGSPTTHRSCSSSSLDAALDRAVDSRLACSSAQCMQRLLSAAQHSENSRVVERYNGP